jgi:catechol 2,3-dioxygenase-like lactoylglutathione lyase family enzyme
MIDRFDHLCIRPADFGRSLAFYRDTLGWAVVSAWGEPGARGAMLSSGATKLVLAEGAAREGDPPDGRPTAHLDIHDVDKRFRELPPGEHVVLSPADTDRGTRWFVVRDPDGNLIAFEDVHRTRG